MATFAVRRLRRLRLGDGGEGRRLGLGLRGGGGSLQPRPPPYPSPAAVNSCRRPDGVLGVVLVASSSSSYSTPSSSSSSLSSITRRLARSRLPLAARLLRATPPPPPPPRRLVESSSSRCYAFARLVVRARSSCHSSSLLSRFRALRVCASSERDKFATCSRRCGLPDSRLARAAHAPRCVGGVARRRRRAARAPPPPPRPAARRCDLRRLAPRTDCGNLRGARARAVGAHLELRLHLDRGARSVAPVDMGRRELARARLGDGAAQSLRAVVLSRAPHDLAAVETGAQSRRSSRSPRAGTIGDGDPACRPSQRLVHQHLIWRARPSQHADALARSVARRSARSNLG